MCWQLHDLYRVHKRPTFFTFYKLIWTPGNGVIFHVFIQRCASQCWNSLARNPALPVASFSLTVKCIPSLFCVKSMLAHTLYINTALCTVQSPFTAVLLRTVHFLTPSDHPVHGLTSVLQPSASHSCNLSIIRSSLGRSTFKPNQNLSIYQNTHLFSYTKTTSIT